MLLCYNVNNIFVSLMNVSVGWTVRQRYPTYKILTVILRYPIESREQFSNVNLTEFHQNIFIRLRPF